MIDLAFRVAISFLVAIAVFVMLAILILAATVPALLFLGLLFGLTWAVAISMIRVRPRG